MQNRIVISFILNGTEVSIRVAENARLIDVLREELGLNGAKEGCGIGECGACTVMLDGRTVNSCLVMAAGIAGKEVRTIEGSDNDGELNPIQQAVIDKHAFQCGFCTPGLIMSAQALLEMNPKPTRKQIKTAISGNLCRCTGYEKMIEAIEDVADGRYDLD